MYRFLLAALGSTPMRRLILFLFVLVVVAPRLAHAEVMDKEASVSEIWAWALFGGCAAVLAWRVHVWLGAFVSVALGLFFVSLWSEFADPFVGPAIRSEAGVGYVLTAVFATIVAIGFTTYGSFRALAAARHTGAAAAERRYGCPTSTTNDAD